MTSINPHSWQRLQDLFAEVIERDEAERDAFIDEACGSDDRLRTQLEQLLADFEPSARELDLAPSPVSSLGKLFDGSLFDNSERPLPKQIGQYIIKGIIASGGMGTVYRAEQQSPQRTVAVKVIRRTIVSRSALRRFEYESRLLAHLRHPGIAQVYEAGVHGDGGDAVPYFAMEYIPGALTITDYADANDLGVRDRLDLLARTCDAVAHGHQKGIIHRDLKPANILVDEAGQPKIIDFGVARSTDADIAFTTMLTDVGQLIGTLQYMSPEQYAGDPNDIDTRSDVYALGLITYELLCGRVPYDVSGMTIYEATRLVNEVQPPRLSSTDRRLRGDIETIVRKAIEKGRDRRYQSVGELAADIRRYLVGDAILARAPSRLYRCRVFARRNKTLVAGVLIATVAIIAGVVGTTIGMIRAEHRRQEAEAVTQYLAEAIGSIHPNIAQGRDVTVREMLHQLERKLESDASFRRSSEAEATLRSAIGNTYAKLRTYHPDAERHLKRALAIRRQTSGSDHEKVAESLHDLAAAIRWKRDADSRPLFEEALSIRRRRFGDAHPLTLATMERLANLFRDRGDFDAAHQTYQHVLDARRNAPAADQVALARTLTSLGALFRDFGRYDEAEPLYRQSLEIHRRISESDSRLEVANTLYELGLCLHWAGREPEAEDVLRQCDAIVKRLWGDENLWRGHNCKELGECLLAQGRFDEAFEYLQFAADMYSRDADRDNTAGTQLRYVAVKRTMGQCLREMRRYEEAEQQLKESYRTLQQTPDRSWYGNQMGMLSKAFTTLYEKWGKPDQAAKWQAKLDDAENNEPELPNR